MLDLYHAIFLASDPKTQAITGSLMVFDFEEHAGVTLASFFQMCAKQQKSEAMSSVNSTIISSSSCFYLTKEPTISAKTQFSDAYSIATVKKKKC